MADSVEDSAAMNDEDAGELTPVRSGGADAVAFEHRGPEPRPPDARVGQLDRASPPPVRTADTASCRDR